MPNRPTFKERSQEQAREDALERERYERERRENVGPFTYFIQAVRGGPVKIGKSSTRDGVRRRLTTIQTGNPEPLRVTHMLAGDREAELHRRFYGARLVGEWFVAVPELADLGHAITQEDSDQSYGRGFHDGFNLGACKVYDAAADYIDDALVELQDSLRQSMRSAFSDLDHGGTDLMRETVVRDVFAELERGRDA